MDAVEAREDLGSPTREGMPEEFGALWKVWAPRAASFALSFPWLSAEDREDLVTEALIKAWLARDRYDPRRPFAPWFFTILRRLALDALRSRRERAAPPERFVLEADSRAGAEAALAKDTEEAFVAAYVGRLEPRDRELANLVYGQDLGPTEAAVVIGMAVGTVKWRLHRIRQGLRKAWEREYGI